MPKISPNRIRTMSPLVASLGRDTMITPRANMPTNNNPIAVSDDSPERLVKLTQIEGCYSVAGEESYILKVRVPSPGDLEALLAQIRAAANVRTRTTVVLSTPYEGRPPAF